MTAGANYDEPLARIAHGGSLAAVGAGRISDLVRVRRLLRDQLLSGAGPLAAEDRPAQFCYVGQAEIRNAWAALTTTAVYAEGTRERANLDAITFEWCPRVDTLDDRAVLVLALLRVTARPADVGTDIRWRFYGPDGYEDRVDPWTGQR